ncbi:MAG: hypothetical protein CME90_11820 [Hoeflea sp.]|nr:hypothetical protein [Hoeflea sp.]|tara:strand:- start:8610 stop:9080 length:471 start_codon:yes stop_codon:yes gene_type:complete
MLWKRTTIHPPRPVKVKVPARPQRARVLKGAHAAFNHEFSAVPCTVRDLSETGAKVHFEDGFIVPDRFTLFVEVDGIKVDCERVWLKGQNCGVRFIGPVTRTRAARPQVISRYDTTDSDDGASQAASGQTDEGGFAGGGRPARRPQGASHFGKRER